TVATVAGRVEHQATGVVEAPASEQTAGGRDLLVFAREDLRRRADDVPDAHFVHRAGEEAGRHARRVEGAADGRVLDAVRSRRPGDRQRERAVLHAVQIELPRLTVVGCRGVIPDVVQ